MVAEEYPCVSLGLTLLHKDRMSRKVGPDAVSAVIAAKCMDRQPLVSFI